MGNFFGVLLGVVVYILLGPGMLFTWLARPKNSRGGSGELGLAVIISILFWAVAMACGVGFLLHW